MVDWNLYLARYQQTHGGSFFGGDQENCPCQLLLPQQDRSPLLVLTCTDSLGRSSWNSLRARAMVRLNKPYRLRIGPRGLMGSGVSGMASLVGKTMDFGFSEIKGRVITTDNRPFTKLLLGDLALRNALGARDRDHLEVGPSPLGDDWHMVEVFPHELEGMVKNTSTWVNDAMEQSTSFMTPEEQEAVLRSGSAHFDAQLDALLALLQAARDALSIWPVP